MAHTEMIGRGRVIYKSCEEQPDTKGHTIGNKAVPTLFSWQSLV